MLADADPHPNLGNTAGTSDLGAAITAAIG
jgi:hypothetical protein